MKQTKINIREELKKIRKELGFSLKYVSSKTGISFNYIGQIERGDRKGNLEVVEKMLSFYNKKIKIINK